MSPNTGKQCWLWRYHDSVHESSDFRDWWAKSTAERIEKVEYHSRYVIESQKKGWFHDESMAGFGARNKSKVRVVDVNRDYL